MRLWPLAALAVIGGLAFGMVITAGPDPGAVPTTDEVAARMMSPFCPGLTLEECPSDQASRLRGEINQMVLRGDTNEQIDRWIVDNFGEVALARPDGTLAWVAPPLAVLAGLFVIMLVLRRRQPPGQARTPIDEATSQLTPEEERVFDKDFGNFRRGSE